MPGQTVAEVSKIVAKGARHVKNQMRDEAKSSGHYKHFHRSISYDIRGLEAEIGPDKTKVQGALGNILYFGTSKNGPVLNIQAPLDAEEPRFVRALSDVVEDIL